MFAAIMKSQTPVGIRSTVVIPVGDKVRVFSRIGEGRGIAGAWKEGDVDIQPNEMTVGEPVSVAITPNDYAVLGYPVSPTVLLQKLGRTLKGVTNVTQANATATFDDIYNMASENPAGLAVFMNAMKQVQASQPSTVQPIVIPSVVSSYIPTVQEPTPQPVEPEPVAYVAPPVTQLVESEPPMALTTAPVSNADAVLTVPPIKEYYDREYFGLPVMTILDDARAHQENVLFTGPAGTGKTSCAEYYAATRNLPFVTIECTQQIDQGITQGRFVPTGVGNSTKWRYSQLATAIQQPSVILINELTRMSPKAASLFLRLLQERELLIEPLNEVIKVHPGCIFIADQNIGSGYTGTSKQDAALVDRFNQKIEFDYDTKIEAKFIPSPTLLSFATAIRQASELNDEFSVPLSTRVLKNFVSQAKRLNFEFAVNSMLNNYPKSDGERDALKMRFDAECDAIATELGVDKGKYSTK